ncbi:MAG: transcriptional regulator, partial [Sulfuricurvum sp.]|nr:transcriptional regulator [Sulfuricurvum sp.]
MDILSITNVLILGNDETEISSLQQSLDSYGYQLSFSSGTTKNLENSLLEYSPDVVLIQIDPLSLNESLSLGRFLDKQGKVPFIYLSSGGDDSTLFKAQKTHPYCYLVQPFDAINLHSSLQCALHCFKKHKVSNSIMQQ